MTPEEELQRGSEARQLLNNPIFKEVMDSIRNELNDLSDMVDTTDHKLCADVIMRKQVFNSIEGKIKQMIDTGKMAQMQMEAEIKMNKPRKFER